jgi:rubrerythrin
MGTTESRSPRTWPELIQTALDIEESGGAIYAAAAGETKGRMKRILEDFSAVKRRHAEMLSGIGSGLPKDSPGIAFNRTLLQYLERGRRLAESFGSTLVILEFSINFEEEALRFYRSLLGHAPDSIRSVIEAVVRENGEKIEEVRTLAVTTLTGFDTPKGI